MMILIYSSTLYLNKNIYNMQKNLYEKQENIYNLEKKILQQINLNN